MNRAAKNTLKYVLLPGILPRFWSLVSGGFAQIATCIAMAFGATGLLPRGHVFLNPAYAGHFGIRVVMSEGRRHLVFRRALADQVIVYYTILIGLFLLLFQAGMAVAALAAPHAWAADSSNDMFTWGWSKFFTTQNAAGDLAFIMLDLIFGFKGLYGSCADPSISCPSPLHSSPGGTQWPTSFHTALHGFIEFYDLGIAIVGFIILLYLITSMVGETANSGHPFGERASPWFLARLIVAIGLIAPLSDGLNGAQKTTLYIAKWGSNLASNGWVVFNSKLTGTTPAGFPTSKMVVSPRSPDADGLMEFMLVARTCQYLEKWDDGAEVKAWQITSNGSSGYQAQEMNSNLSNAIDETNSDDEGADGNDSSGDTDVTMPYGDVLIVFGQQDNSFDEFPGNVYPTCGKIIFRAKDLAQSGAATVQQAYYQMVYQMWNGSGGAKDIDTYAQNIAKTTTRSSNKDPGAQMPDKSFVDNMRSWAAGQITSGIQSGRTTAQNDAAWTKDATSLGWGGAALWYNRIAQINGSFVSSVYGIPSPTLYPDVMEYIKAERGKTNSTSSGDSRFSPYLANNRMIAFRSPAEEAIAIGLYKAQKVWLTRYKPTNGSPLEDLVRLVFSDGGLINYSQNVGVSPLAQLVGMGRSLIEKSIYAFGAGAVGGIAGGLAQISSNLGLRDASGLLIGMGQMATKIGAICMLIGFFLYYVLPTLPFIYFFFAMGNWVKAVFEAMVGLPLWALSFLKIDGHGLTGPTAGNGWYLLLDILIRPILILFGLIGSITIFTAQIIILNDVWGLVVANVTGGSGAPVTATTTTTDSTSSTTDLSNMLATYVRDPFDQFMYTILYAITVYMTATSAFKLIDLIPATILRWMGSHVHGFNDRNQDAESFLKNMTRLTQQVQAAVSEDGGILGQMLRQN